MWLNGIGYHEAAGVSQNEGVLVVLVNNENNLFNTFSEQNVNSNDKCDSIYYRVLVMVNNSWSS